MNTDTVQLQFGYKNIVLSFIYLHTGHNISIYLYYVHCLNTVMSNFDKY